MGFVAFGIGGVVNAGSFGILHAFPAWLMSRHCLRVASSESEDVNGVPVGEVLGVIALAAATIVVLGSIYVADDTVGIQGTVSGHITEVFSIMGLGGATPEIAQLRETLVHVFPAAMGVSWVLMTVLNAVLAKTSLSA